MLSGRLIADIKASLQANWERPALSDYQGVSYTYKEVAWRIACFHELFRKNHIKPGAKIALIGKNSANWTLTYLAALTYGAVIVPILPDFNADNVQHIVNHSDAVLLFAADDIYDKLDEAKMPRLDAVLSLTDFALLHHRKKHFAHVQAQRAAFEAEHDAASFSPDALRFADIDNQALAEIVYTSGTTGFSKGVMLTHASLLANGRFAQDNMPLEAGDHILSFLPLAHAYGCAFEFLFPFTKGCHITLLGKTPSPKIILNAFQEIRPRLILSVPLVIEKIYAKQIKPTLQKPLLQALFKIPPLRKVLLKKICRRLCDAFGGNFHEIIIGGAALNKEVETFFKELRFPFTIGYGMTECGPLISYAPWTAHRALSVGTPIDYLDVKIDSDDPQHAVGEILVRGENVMQGYYKNEAATREALDADGWLRTGDLGVLDEDGYIYIKGRCKNMILGASGQNIYPEEIEAQLNNLPFIQESLVQEKDGQLVALVYPDLALADAKGVDEARLTEKMERNRQAINTRLPTYSLISRIELYPREFEKTPTRKIKRFLYTHP